jgi:putative PIN family toxin of toxin-antitoxin system
LRIVLDTNVLISGIFFTGPPNKILRAWKERKLQVVFSPDIYFEYLRVAELISSKYPNIEISEILNLMAVHAEIIQSSTLPDQVCEDPDDDKFIACALSGKVDFIISGDKKLLQLSEYEGIRILKPRTFCEEFIY